MAIFVFSLALAAPIFARLSEGWFNLAPCELCLWQRAPYWVAAALALAAALLPRARPWLLLGAALAAAVSAAIGAFHLGVEFRWWPSPLAGCAAPQAGAGASIEERQLTEVLTGTEFGDGLEPDHHLGSAGDDHERFVGCRALFDDAVPGLDVYLVGQAVDVFELLGRAPAEQSERAEVFEMIGVGHIGTLSSAPALVKGPLAGMMADAQSGCGSQWAMRPSFGASC